MAERWKGGPVELPHEFTHAGVRIMLPAVSTEWLLETLAYGRWTDFYPGLVPEGLTWQLDMRMADPRDRVIDIWQFGWVARTLLGRVAGTFRYRPDPQPPDDGYTAARVLSARVLFNWPQFAAWCATRNLDPLGVPFWMLMGAAYAWQQELNPTAELASQLDALLWPMPKPSRRAELTAADGAGGAPLESAPSGPEVSDRVPVIPQHLLDEEAEMAQQQLREMGLL